LEEALDLSFDRLLMMMMMMCNGLVQFQGAPTALQSRRLKKTNSSFSR